MPSINSARTERGQGHWPSAAIVFWSISTIVAGIETTCRVTALDKRRTCQPQAFGPPRGQRDQRRERDEDGNCQEATMARPVRGDFRCRAQEPSGSARAHNSISIPS